MKDFKQMLENSKQDILKNTRELLMIPSVLEESSDDAKPFGENIDKALHYMIDLAKKDGFDTELDGGYAGSISYGNNDGKTVGVLCHLDVVPAGKGWDYDPFSATIIGDKLFARGAIDDKGPTIAAYYALKFIKDAGIKLKNKIEIILGTDEETGWRGITHYLEHHKMPDLGFAPDASFPLIYGEKGRMSFDLSRDEDAYIEDDVLVSIKGGDRYNVVLDEVEAIVKKDITLAFASYASSNNLKYSVAKDGDVYKLVLKGLAAHAMEPFVGINAGTYMCDFLKDYTKNTMVQYIAKYYHLDFYLKNQGLDYCDYEMKEITCNIGIMDINNHKDRVTLDMRFPVRYDLDKFNTIFNKLLKEYNIIITDKTLKSPHYVSPDSKLVKDLYQAYVNHTNDTENLPFTIGGGTYASILDTAVAFGMAFPNEEDLCHQANEYISINSLYTSILIYIDAMIALGEEDA